MLLNIIAFSGLLIAITSSVMAIVMFALSKNRTQRLWGFFCIAVFVWGGSFYFIATATDPENAKFWWKISHIGVVFIPVLFLQFVLEFLNVRKYFLLSLLYIISFGFLISDLHSNLLIDKMRFVFDKFYYDSPPAPLYTIFVTYFQALIIYGHYLLFKAYVTSKDVLIRERIRYFFMATFVGFLGGGLSFLPVFNIDIYPSTIITVSLYPVIMGYAILKYNLFNVKLVTAQLLVSIIIIFTAARLILSQTSNEVLINIFLLIITVALGYYLVRSVRNEVEAREEIERLAKDLATANERLKELDKLKSEFVSIASHQLRSPLAAIKGYASLIMDGSFGKTTPGIKEAVEKIFHSSQSLVSMVEDFLNISRIEQGRMKYEFAIVDMKKLTEEIIGELKPSIERSGLDVSFSTDHSGSYCVNADYGKMRQVINNLIDNAIKYTPKGSISITLSKKPKTGKLLLAFSDTGIGIDPATLPHLFAKFSRSKDANKVNVIGTGLGLYIAREIINGHHGRIWAESEGKGKGTTFFVELEEESVTSHTAKVADFAKTM